MDAEILERLNRFGASLLGKRKEAIQARKSSGIEEIWLEDDEFYQGIDDANRDKVSTSLSKNRVDRAGAFRPSSGKRRGSNVFMNITRQYVDCASSSLADMLLPTDDATFLIQPTPLPKTLAFAGAKPRAMPQQPPTQAQLLPQPMPSGQPAAPGFSAPGQMAPQTPTTSPIATPMQGMFFHGQTIPLDVFEQMQQQDAKARADAAQKQIEDWLVEAGWHSQVRHVLKDAARIGTGILKGCYPVISEAKSFHVQDGVAELVIDKELKPASKRIDPLNFFPDPACGTDIHKGSYVWEREYFTAKQLRQLKGNGGYLDDQIDAVLKEGSGYFDGDSKDGGKNGQYTIWYYYGTAKAEDIRAAGCECEEEDLQDVMVVMVNDRVIKATMNPLESGEFPYDVMVWQAMSDSWTGIGIARQVREPQRIINAATRNLLDNAGKGGSPILVLADGVEAADGGRVEISKDMILRMSPDSNQPASQAVSSIIIPIITGDLMSIIQYAQKMAEDITGLPMLLQGQQGSAPETVGGMTMLQNNSSSIRRNIARFFDDRVTVPHINRYYEWLMLFGDEDCKGDFNIEARGSTALFERDAQSSAIMQMGQMVMNPAFHIDPNKWFQEAAKAQRLDPKRFQYSDEEIQQQQAQAQQNSPSPPPAVAAAQIRVQGDIQKAQLTQHSDMAELQLKERLMQQELSFKAQQADLDRQHNLQMMAFQRDMKVMELSQQSQKSINEINAQLAQTSQKLNVQAQLSVADMQHKQAMAPLV